MKRFSLIAITFLCSCWALSGCPQISQSVNGPGNQVVDAPVAEAPPQTGDVAANAEPIDPKTDPRTIGGGTATGGTDTGSADGGHIVISGNALKGGPVQLPPFVDVRLRYGKDSQILAKSPDAAYVVYGKSAKISLSFLTDVTWDPNLEDSSWVALMDSFDVKPQLRAVYIPKDDPDHALYCDAVWSSDDDGKIVYSFSDLSVSNGELRFFMKNTKSSDFHTATLTPLVSGDPAQPFPADADPTVYSLGAFRLRAVEFSTPHTPILQNGGQLPPLKF